MSQRLIPLAASLIKGIYQHRLYRDILSDCQKRPELPDASQLPGYVLVAVCPAPDTSKRKELPWAFPDERAACDVSISIFDTDSQSLVFRSVPDDLPLRVYRCTCYVNACHVLFEIEEPSSCASGDTINSVLSPPRMSSSTMGCVAVREEACGSLSPCVILNGARYPLSQAQAQVLVYDKNAACVKAILNTSEASRLRKA